MARTKIVEYDEATRAEKERHIAQADEEARKEIERMAQPLIDAHIPWNVAVKCLKALGFIDGKGKPVQRVPRIMS